MKTDSTIATPTADNSAEPLLSPVLLGNRLRAARANKGLTQEQAGEKVGLSRLALLQIEAGTRDISSLELLRLAHCYGRQIEDFLEECEPEESPKLILGRIVAQSSVEWDEQIEPFLRQLGEAVKLTRFIGESAVALPPLYQLKDPVSYKEAIEQGKEMAALERRRLDLGAACIDDVAEIISCQSIWTAAVPFPDNVSGLFLRHSQYGLAVLINCEHSRARRRFSYAHEYAHALVDREKKSTPTSRQNASELVEKRANAFASEFLMPESGVWESLERMRKGAASREYSLLYDVASDEVFPHETRNDALSQRITVSEIAILAHEFKVSYDVAAYRLSDIGAIKRPHLEDLLEQRENGRQLIEHLGMYNGDADDKDKGQPHLERQLVFLAIEALRRDKITPSQFCDIFEGSVGYEPEKSERLLRIASGIV